MAQMPRTIDHQSNLQPGTTGLLAAAVGPMPMPDHATFAGIEFVSDLCGDGYLYPGVCDTTPPTKTFDVCDDGPCGLTEGAPFLTYVSEVCGPGRSMAAVNRAIRRKAQLRESLLVERAFWGDDSGVPGYLQGLGETPIATAASVTEALSLLEQDAADNFGLPVTIHARAGLAAIMSNANLLVRSSGGVLTTWKGNRVVFGDGYGAVDAAGDAFADGVTQLWATGPVNIWRGDLMVPPAPQVFNRGTNQQYMLAEMPWIIAVECYASVITLDESGA